MQGKPVITVRVAVIAVMTIFFLVITLSGALAVPVASPDTVVVVVGAQNASLFSITTDTGVIDSYFVMYPEQSRTLGVIVNSLENGSRTLSVSCVGNFCKNVVLSDSSVKVGNFGSKLLSAKLTVPSTAKYGDKYDFKLVVVDAEQHSAVLKNTVEVSKVSSWFQKFKVVVKEGDDGFWFSAQSLKVPKLILFILVTLLAEIVLYFILPQKLRERELGIAIQFGFGILIFVISSVVL